MFVFFSGRKSWRFEDAGLWFISVLCEVLQERAYYSELMSILTEVNKRLAKIIDHGSEGLIIQIGEKTDNLKKIAFSP